jgi:phosphohistidine phosphatase
VQVYLLRHAIAATPDAERYPNDDDRPLTREGRRRMEQAARGMRALELKFDLVLTSPLVRARETAKLAIRPFRPRPPIKVLRPLSPGGGAGGILAGLTSLPGDASVLLVGHEPDLSGLAGALLLQHRDEFSIEFKKGALVRIDFDAAPRLGAGRLIHHLPPKVLRGLAPAPAAD